MPMSVPPRQWKIRLLDRHCVIYFKLGFDFFLLGFTFLFIYLFIYLDL
jgi:hypothetical protein